MAHGFRILERTRRVDEQTVRQFRELPVANVSDVMSRLTAGGPNLRPLHAGGPLAGPAFTVKTRPGDNLMVHKALLMAKPGDVIVVDAGGELSNALVGEMMLSHAIQIGVAGVVINGAVRDYGWIKNNSFPVFAAGITHRGPYKDGPGEINVPVSIGGMVVNPGDIVVGDQDGLLAFPQTEAVLVIEKAKAQMLKEAQTMQAMREGRWDRSFIDALEARCAN